MYFCPGGSIIKTDAQRGRKIVLQYLTRVAILFKDANVSSKPLAICCIAVSANYQRFFDAKVATILSFTRYRTVWYDEYT